MVSGQFGSDMSDLSDMSDETEKSHCVPTTHPSPLTPVSTLSLALRKYRWRYSGHVAFWIQRLTGLALLGYLFVHVHTIRNLKDPQSFDAALAFFRAPVFKLGEIALLGTVILHALNGIRLTLVDAGVGLPRQREMFWYGVVGLGAILFLAGAVPMFLYGWLR